MDLFTYLMAKNGNNSSVHGDLFSYLLGKGQSQTQTISGVTINIPDAKKLVSFMMTKESTQDGTPTPDYPQEVKTVKGYSNLFDISTVDYVSRCTLSDEVYTTTALNVGARNVLFGYLSNNQYTINVGETIYVSADIRLVSGTASNLSTLKVDDNFTVNGILNPTVTNEFQRYIFENTNNTASSITKGRILFQPSNTNLSDAVFEIKNVMISKDNIDFYVHYGNNYVNVAVSDGTNTNNYSIPLNNNEIVGIGNYKDELIVDKGGNVYINKKTGKKLFDGSESWTLNSSSASRTIFAIQINDIEGYTSGNQKPNLLSNRFIPVSYNDTWVYGNVSRFTGSTVQKLIPFIFEANKTVEDFKTWLSTHNTELYYVLATPTMIDLNTKVDIRLFKGANTITNSENGYMTIEYR